MKQRTLEKTLDDIRNNRVTSVDLNENNIGDKGAAAILKIVEVNHNITEINLGNNDIGNELLGKINNAPTINKGLATQVAIETLNDLVGIPNVLVKLIAEYYT